jgi:hypothetical protein
MQIIIELRLNGTLRERVKMQRGWKSHKSAIAEGQRIEYNFVKHNMALEGETPAKKAGVVSRGKNKWMELLENYDHSISQEPLSYSGQDRSSSSIA